MSSNEIHTEMDSANVQKADFEIAELAKIIEYFELKHGPFMDTKSVHENVDLPHRPLFLIDFMLKQKMLREAVDEARFSMRKKAAASAES